MGILEPDGNYVADVMVTGTIREIAVLLRVRVRFLAIRIRPSEC